jgi:hypothetical protein
VINAGVELDSSFVEQYGDYPLVTDYDRTDENCPWEIRYRETGALFSPQNWWEVPDFMDLQVVGNRDDLSPSVQFSPASWEGYVHPEGVDMFVTKFWHKTTWDAVAQRQYLKIGGQILNYQTGALTSRGYGVLLHEMGHTMYLDDIYDRKKYARCSPRAAGPTRWTPSSAAPSASLGLGRIVVLCHRPSTSYQSR